MKKKVMVEKKFCDVCGNVSLYTCFLCDTDFCYDHKKENIISYRIDPRYANDVDVCVECDEESDDPRLLKLKELELERKRREKLQKQWRIWDQKWVKEAHDLDPELFGEW